MINFNHKYCFFFYLPRPFFSLKLLFRKYSSQVFSCTEQGKMFRVIKANMQFHLTKQGWHPFHPQKTQFKNFFHSKRLRPVDHLTREKLSSSTIALETTTCHALSRTFYISYVIRWLLCFMNFLTSKYRYFTEQS